MPPLRSLSHSQSSTPHPAKQDKASKGLSSLERDLNQAIRSKSRLLLRLQQATSVNKALRYLQLREAGCSQASAIDLSKKLMRKKTEAMMPRYVPYVANEDFINYDAIDAAYARFEEHNVIVKGMVHRKHHMRASSDLPPLSTPRLRGKDETPGILLTRQRASPTFDRHL